jgi:hypothetical protein
VEEIFNNLRKLLAVGGQRAAELLKIGKRSVYKLAIAKKIPAKKVLNKEITISFKPIR